MAGGSFVPRNRPLTTAAEFKLWRLFSPADPTPRPCYHIELSAFQRFEMVSTCPVPNSRLPKISGLAIPERKRKVAIKCLELEEMLERQGWGRASRDFELTILSQALTVRDWVQGGFFPCPATAPDHEQPKREQQRQEFSGTRLHPRPRNDKAKGEKVSGETKQTKIILTSSSFPPFSPPAGTTWCHQASLHPVRSSQPGWRLPRPKMLKKPQFSLHIA